MLEYDWSEGIDYISITAALNIVTMTEYQYIIVSIETANSQGHVWHV